MASVRLLLKTLDYRFVRHPLEFRLVLTIAETFWCAAWGLDNALAVKCVPTPPAASTMRAGFKLVATKEHDEYGKTPVGETWELDLGQQSWQ